MLIQLVVWLCLMGDPSPARQVRPVQPEHLIGLAPQAVEWVLGEKPVYCSGGGIEPGSQWSGTYLNAGIRVVYADDVVIRVRHAFQSK